jgi:hypothetical protein
MLEDGVNVRFYKGPKLMGALSDAAKRPVYEDRDFIEIKIVGEKDLAVHEVREEHRTRFPRNWEAYLRGQNVAHDGTPLESWPEMTPAKVLNLKGIGIFTVEELAAISDANVTKIPEGRKARESAIAYLQRSSEAGAAAEVSALREQVQALTEQGAAQSAQLAKSMDLIERLNAELQSRSAPSTEAGAAAEVKPDAKQKSVAKETAKA